MIKRTLVCMALCGLMATGSFPLGFLKSVTMPDGRVISISAGNPKD
ncbi:MAG: hypothetical protein HYU27_07805 [Acidobacteria bacterium]|nr:hypothetical protein [Acidobacteriota bacterium]